MFPNLPKKVFFDKDGAASWDRPSKTDIPVAEVSCKACLPLDAIKFLKNPLDKKAEGFLREAWESPTEAFNQYIALACVARSLLAWLN